MQRLLVAALFGVFILHAALPLRAQEPSTLFINLTSDDVWTQQMALQFGRNFVDLTDGELVVFLNVRSVGVANENVPQHTTALTGKTPRQLVAELIDAGARVFLCAGCTDQAGLSIDDRIDGVMPSGPELHRILAAPGTKVISY